MPAPCASMAICGAPSASPAWLMGWQMTSLHPSRLGCLRVATTEPSTRARSIIKIWRSFVAPLQGAKLCRSVPGVSLRSTPGYCPSPLRGAEADASIDPQVVHHHAAADAGEGFGVGDAFAGGRGDGVA